MPYPLGRASMNIFPRNTQQVRCFHLTHLRDSVSLSLPSSLQQSCWSVVFMVTTKQVWSSGYDVSLTRWRSPDRSRVPAPCRVQHL